MDRAVSLTKRFLGVDESVKRFGAVAMQALRPSTLFGTGTSVGSAKASMPGATPTTTPAAGNVTIPEDPTESLIADEISSLNQNLEQNIRALDNTLEANVKLMSRDVASLTRQIADQANDMDLNPDSPTKRQIDDLIEEQEATTRAILNLDMGGGMMGAFPMGGNRFRGKGGRGGRAGRIAGRAAGAAGLGAGANALRGATQAKLPAGTKLNSAGQLVDEKTGRFVKDPAKQTQKKINENIQDKVKKKVGLKIGAKLATRGALAATGIGAIASGGLLAYDVGEAIFSKGARAEYTLANPAASEEDRMEAMDYLIKEDPARLGVEGLEDVSPEQRMSFLAAQDENPELTSEQFNTQMIEEQGGPTDKQLADLQTRVTDQTSGFFNRKGNDLEEAQAMIKSSGMEGKVIAKETNNGIELERVTEDTTKTEQAAQQTPVIVNAPQQGPMSQPDIVVTLPKTILSQNPSARKFIASTF